MDTTNVEITINNKVRVLHFSDGVEEEVIEEKDIPESTSEPSNEVDPKTLSWGPWLSHYAWQSGSNVLYAIDYAGETLANFFGITTPKYVLELNEYERLQEEKKKLEEETASWVPKSGSDIPLVLTEPLKENTQHV